MKKPGLTLRSLLSDSLLYGLGAVLARFVNYVLVPVHTNVFAPESYITIGLVYAVIAISQVVFSLGMESAYIKYSKDRTVAVKVFRSGQWVLLGVATILGVMLFGMQNVLADGLRIPEGVTSIIFASIAMILWMDTMVVLPMAELRVSQRPLVFASLRMIHVVLNVGLNIWFLLGQGMGVEAVFVSNAIASTVMAIGAWVVTWATFSQGEWDATWARKAFSFGWPLIPAGLAHILNEMVDRFFLTNMSPADVERIYGAGMSPEAVAGLYNGVYKLSVFMLLVVQMFRLAWQPFFMRHGDQKEAPRLFARAFVGLSLLSSLVVLWVGSFASDIAMIQLPGTEISLLDAAYLPALDVVPWLLLAYALYGWYIYSSVGIYLNGSSRTLGWITVTGAGVTLVMNALLVPVLGMMGSAIATVCSYGVMATVLSIRSHILYPISTPWWLGVGMLAFGVFVPLSMQTDWLGQPLQDLANQWRFGLVTGVSALLLAIGWSWERRQIRL
ncbi:MAG: oligosaccharide flippase family protein [Balneolaceae bacterium]|nr:oligosaccharide flippase family protein [Balneolaceae bacterium]